MSGLNQRQRHPANSETLSVKPLALTWLNVDYQVPPVYVGERERQTDRDTFVLPYS